MWCLRLILKELEKCMREQKKQPEPCEAVRMHSSFLFAGTAEGALCRIFLLAHFCDTHTHTHTPSALMTDKHQMYVVCLCKNTHTHIVLFMLTCVPH